MRLFHSLDSRVVVVVVVVVGVRYTVEWRPPCGQPPSSFARHPPLDQELHYTALHCTALHCTVSLPDGVADTAVHGRLVGWLVGGWLDRVPYSVRHVH